MNCAIWEKLEMLAVHMRVIYMYFPNSFGSRIVSGPESSILSRHSGARIWDPSDSIRSLADLTRDSGILSHTPSIYTYTLSNIVSLCKDEDDCSGTMKPLPEDSRTLVPSHDLPDTGTLVSAMLDLGTMVINSDTDTEATMKS